MSNELPPEAVAALATIRNDWGMADSASTLERILTDQAAALEAERGYRKEARSELAGLRERLEAAERERNDALRANMDDLQIKAQRDRLAEALREAVDDLKAAIAQVPTLQINRCEREARSALLIAKLERYQSALDAIDTEAGHG